ncbi:MAG: hypothetical protein AB8F78_11690 [Saprospiraceae bacterium]
MMKQLVTSIFFSLLLLSAQRVLAQAETARLQAKFLVEAGYECGGVDLEGIYFGSTESQSLSTGQGGSLGIGGQVEFRDFEYLMLRSMLGYKLAFTGTGNERVHLSRFPFHLSAFYRVNDNLRAGIGAATHFNAKVGGKGAFKEEDLASSWSPRFELGYKWIGVTYTPIAYSTERHLLTTKAIGMFLSIPFASSAKL